MSEVSTTWNKLAESKNIGDKVQLEFEVEEISVEDFKTIANSSRNYTNVSIKAESEASSSALRIFAGTAEKLTVDITDRRSSKISKNFPMLKSLEIISDPYQQDSWIFHSQVDQIEELKFVVEEEVRSNEIFHNFLQRQINLKRLDLSDSDYGFGYCTYRPLFELEYLKAYFKDLP
jgi:hypothetical protein